MKKIPSRLLMALLSGLACGSVHLRAQTTPSPTPASPSASEEEETIMLDPFTVTTEHEGYTANDTLGGARIRTKLIDTPSATSVITPKFMQDLGVHNSEDLLRYTTSTESGGFYGNYSGLTSRGSGVAGEGDRLINSGNINRARGISNLDNTRNYMLSSIPWDGYNVSRVDMTRGPNSFLFGAGSPSGILNYATKDASYKDSGSVEGTYGSFGSTRGTLDINKVIVPDQVALRLDLVDDRKFYQQDPAFNHSKRGYAAIRLDPKFLEFPSARTKIQANYERGQTRSNNARILPPMDYFSGYLGDATKKAGGINAWLMGAQGANSDLNESHWASQGSIGNWYQWDHAAFYKWDASSGQLLAAGDQNFTLPGAIEMYGGSPNRFHVHSIGYSGYATNENRAYRLQHGGVDGGPFAGAELGYVKYFDQTMTNRNYFDFFNHLIDGDNKREYQDWKAYSANLTQSLFNNRLNIQAVYAYEKYSRGSAGMLEALSPTIMLDLDEYLLDVPSWMGGTKNPNVNRPLLFGPYGSASNDWTERENTQLNAVYSLDAADIIKNDKVASIIGKHDFTVLGSRSDATDHNEAYKSVALDPAFSIKWLHGTKPRDNEMSWLAYLGPSALSSTTPFSSLRTNLSPIATNMRVYDPTWIAPASVLPTDPWNAPQPDGSVVARTQLQNPANYRGYTTAYASLLTSDTHKAELLTKSGLKDQRIDSKSFMYQGHFWGDTIIPSFGYREDKTRQRGTNASADPNTGYVRSIDMLDPADREANYTTTRSKSYGVAVHMPKAVKKHLPEDMDISLYYFHGANETPKIRYAIDGTVLPNEAGVTNDYSVAVSYKKIHARLSKFDTKSTHTPASYGSPLGGSGWYIGAAPNWGLTMAAGGLIGYEHPDNSTIANAEMRGATWWTDWGRAPEMQALMPQIAEALKNDFTKLYPQEFWDRFGSNVDVAAIKRGDWSHILKNTEAIFPWYINGVGIDLHGTTAIIDQDVESKGYEFEIGAQPLKGWDVSVNATQIVAVQQKLGEAADHLIVGLNHLFNETAFGKVAEWGGGGQPLVNNIARPFNANVWAPYNVQRALVGSVQPELAKYHFNAVSNYRFDHGPVKGLSIGGAARYQSKQSLGYGIHETEIAPGQKIWISDVNKPLWGKSETHFDLWFGYDHKLTSAIDWRLQVNFRNVGDHTKLVPVTKQPNGDVAQARIQEGQAIDVSMKLTF
jgi:outer membrane receptor protein involved in Fe transport